jgi:hypothetical protein
MKNLIAIQDEYVAEFNAAWSRWSHRKGMNGRPGGHFGRRAYAARRKAEAALRRWRFTNAQIAIVLKDARDMAELERHADAE